MNTNINPVFIIIAFIICLFLFKSSYAQEAITDTVNQAQENNTAISDQESEVIIYPQNDKTDKQIDELTDKVNGLLEELEKKSLLFRHAFYL